MITIRKAQIDDAEKILEYCKVIGKEINNLFFCEEVVLFSIQQEKEYLDKTYHSNDNLYLIAEDNNAIVGACNLTSNPKERLKHNLEMGISIRKDYWGKSIASKLIIYALKFVKDINAKNILLNVRSDNERAKNLYIKFGLKKTGILYNYLKINEQYYDCDIMQLFL